MYIPFKLLIGIQVAFQTNLAPFLHLYFIIDVNDRKALDQNSALILDLLLNECLLMEKLFSPN